MVGGKFVRLSYIPIAIGLQSYLRFGEGGTGVGARKSPVIANLRRYDWRCRAYRLETCSIASDRRESQPVRAGRQTE